MENSGVQLVADIGGTNTRVALCRAGVLQTRTVSKFRNSEFAGLDAVLSRYLSEHGAQACSGVCVALAGPVRDGAGTLTNLAWDISEAGLKATTGAEVGVLLNDLQAQGHGLGHLEASALRRSVRGTAHKPGGDQLVIGIGTGFNVSAVYHTGAGPVLPPAEAGHASLPANAVTDPGFIASLEAAHGFAAIEDMLSGRGFERTYRYLAGQERPAAEIMDLIERGDDEIATRAAAMFVHAMGAVAGDLALIHLPFGGVYFIGGVARAFSRYFERFGFAESLQSKGRFRDLVAEFSVFVVEDDFAALKGCAAHLDAQGKLAK